MIGGMSDASVVKIGKVSGGPIEQNCGSVVTGPKIDLGLELGLTPGKGA